MRIDHSSGVSLPKKLCGFFVHFAGPPAANLSINPDNRSRSLHKSRWSVTIRLFAVGEFFRSGSSFRNTNGFTSRPIRRSFFGHHFSHRPLHTHGAMCQHLRGRHLAPASLTLRAQFSQPRLYLIRHRPIEQVLHTHVPPLNGGPFNTFPERSRGLCPAPPARTS